MRAGDSAPQRADELAVRASVSPRRSEALRREAAAWATGAAGERRVADELAGLGPELLLLHDRLLRPGRSRVNLDHVVVTNAGLFVLDTKNWTGDLTVHRGSLWVHVGPAGDRRHHCRAKDLEKVGWCADVMARTVRVRVHPVVVLASPRHAGFVPQTVGGVEVVPVGRLREWFLRQPVLVTDRERDRVGARCAAAFPPAVGASTALLMPGVSTPTPRAPATPRASLPRPPAPRTAPRRAPRAVAWMESQPGPTRVERRRLERDLERRRLRPRRLAVLAAAVLAVGTWTGLSATHGPSDPITTSVLTALLGH